MNDRGQGLTETALILPLLLIMFVGVFEVGYAIHTQLILDNTVREAARFATKPSNMDLTSPEAAELSYQTVITHMHTSMDNELELEGLIITNLYVETEHPCEDVNNCDCEIAATNPYTSAIVLQPEIEEFYRYSEGVGESRLDISQKVSEMETYNHQINCRYENPDLMSPINHMIAVEIFYSHNQLLGFPGLHLLDPIALYSKSVMRKLSDRE